jgi:HEAT repeat protein
MRKALCLFFCCVLPAALASGCAEFWDNVSSREFRIGSMFGKDPPPLTVLRDSDDGFRRGRALAAMREPLQFGGSQQDQQVFIEILTRSAKSDRDPYCRLAAIKSLGHFKDPRAAEALRDVTEQNLAFTTDLNNIIRQEALKSLAETGSPLAVQKLVQVAKEPPAEGAKLDQQEVLDRRLAAIRGLGKYDYPESKETLLFILQKERDPALRADAQHSLKALTGKDLPADAEQWAKVIHPERGGAPDRDMLANQSPNNVWDYITWPIRQVVGH